MTATMIQKEIMLTAAKKTTQTVTVLQVCTNWSKSANSLCAWISWFWWSMQTASPWGNTWKKSLWPESRCWRCLLSWWLHLSTFIKMGLSTETSSRKIFFIMKLLSDCKLVISVSLNSIPLTITPTPAKRHSLANLSKKFSQISAWLSTQGSNRSRVMSKATNKAEGT